MEGQVSAFEFYKAISRITDKTDLNPPRDRYPQFLRMSRQWRHLLQLKRSARGHQPDGAEGTKAGELAVLCPACPQPGMNLPAEIEEQRYARPFISSTSVDWHHRCQLATLPFHWH